MFCLTCSIPLILQQHPMLLCVRIDGFITTRNKQERTQIHNTSWDTQNTHHEVTTDNKLATCIICTITSTRINHMWNQQLVFPSESRILNYFLVIGLISIFICPWHVKINYCRNLIEMIETTNVLLNLKLVFNSYFHTLCYKMIKHKISK